jgi:hypothetical protein
MLLRREKGWRVYRHSLWPARVVMPAFCITVVSLILRGHGNHAVLIGAVVAIGVALQISLERSGIWLSDNKVLVTPIFYGRRTEYLCSEIDRFEIADVNGKSFLTILLKDGRSESLTEMFVSRFQRATLRPIRDGLNRDLDSRLSSLSSSGLIEIRHSR